MDSIIGNTPTDDKCTSTPENDESLTPVHVTLTTTIPPMATATTTISTACGSWKLKDFVKRLGYLWKTVKYCIRKDESDHDVSGKLIVLRSALIVYGVAFLFSLILTKTTFDGHCVGNVDFGHRTLGHPFYSPLGYSACNSNMGAANRDPVYHLHEHNGDEILSWTINEDWHNDASEPGSRTLNILGAVDTNYIRLYGEWFRIFTAVILHAGWMHLLNNCLLHLVIFYIIEPEWKFWRTLVGYFVTGCGGYLTGAVFIPCLRQVGSSGIHFGFMGAMIPFCVENWYKMGSPEIILIVSIIMPLVDISVKQADVGVQIHMGGYLFGLMYGFATIKSVSLFDKGAPYQRFVLKFFSRWLKDSERTKYTRKIIMSLHNEEINRIQYEKVAREKSNRWVFFKRQCGIYPFGPYRMRLRDLITRLASFTLMIVLFAFLILFLYDEAWYTSLNSEVSRAFSCRCTCCHIKQNPNDILQKLQTRYLEGKYFCFRSKEYANRYC